MNTNRIDSSPRTARRALAVLALASLAALTARAQTPLPTSGTGWTLVQTGNNWILNDVADNSAGWTVVTGGSFASVTTRGLSPVTGTGFFNGSNTSGATANRGEQKMFTNLTLEAGTYTVQLSIGAFSDITFQAPTIYLLGDTAANGYSYGDRFVADAGSTAGNATPSAGSWATWSYTFTVSSTTLNNNAPQASVLGSPLGLLILGNISANRGYAFDDVQISFVSASAIPEPATTSALAGGALLAAALVLRRRRSSLRR